MSKIAQEIIEEVIRLNAHLPKYSEDVAEVGADLEAAIDELLKRKDLAARSEKFNGMKLSVSGAVRNATIRGNSSATWGVGEIARLYYEARKAWLSGDMETVADFFGMLV